MEFMESYMKLVNEFVEDVDSLANAFQDVCDEVTDLQEQVAGMACLRTLHKVQHAIGRHLGDLMDIMDICMDTLQERVAMVGGDAFQVEDALVALDRALLGRAKGLIDRMDGAIEECRTDYGFKDAKLKDFQRKAEIMLLGYKLKIQEFLPENCGSLKFKGETIGMEFTESHMELADELMEDAASLSNAFQDVYAEVTDPKEAIAGMKLEFLNSWLDFLGKFNDDMSTLTNTIWTVWDEDEEVDMNDKLFTLDYSRLLGHTMVLCFDDHLRSLLLRAREQPDEESLIAVKKAVTSMAKRLADRLDYVIEVCRIDCRMKDVRLEEARRQVETGLLGYRLKIQEFISENCTCV